MKASSTLQENLQITASTQTINLSNSISPILTRREVASQTDGDRNVGIQANDSPVTMATFSVQTTSINSSLSTVHSFRTPMQSCTISTASISLPISSSSSTFASTSAASSSSSLRVSDAASLTERECESGSRIVSRYRSRLPGTAYSRQNNELAFEGLVQRIFGLAREGDLPALKQLLDRTQRETFRAALHTPSNAAPGPSVTSFTIACKNGHLDIVKFFSEELNVDIEQRSSVVFDGETIEAAPALWCAAATGKLEVVRYLLRVGANINATTATSSTPLRAACFDGHSLVVHYLVENGADIEIANRHGHTCLMIAAYKGHEDIVQFLLERGAHIDRRSKKGNTSLHDASEAGHLSILELLVSRGARMQPDIYGTTPLLAAALCGNTRIVEAFFENKLLMDAVSAVERVAALELLAATYVDKRRDLNLAVNYWLRALRLRSSIAHTPNSLQTSSSSSCASKLTFATSTATTNVFFADNAELVATDMFHTETLPGKLYDIFNEALSAHHHVYHDEPDDPELFSDEDLDDEDDLPIHMVDFQLPDSGESSNELNSKDAPPAAQVVPLAESASAESSLAAAAADNNNNISSSSNSKSQQQEDPEFRPARTEADIAALASNLDAARLHALATRERILGPLHPECNYYLRYRGAAYADSNRFSLCLELWGYALDRLREHWRSSLVEPVTPVICYVQQYYDARYNLRSRSRSCQFTQLKESTVQEELELDDAASMDNASSEATLETEREAYFSNMQSTYLSFQELFGFFVSSEHVFPVDIDVNAMFRVLDCLVSDLELIHQWERSRNAADDSLQRSLWSTVPKLSHRFRELKFPQRSPDRDIAVSRHQMLALNIAAVLLSQRALFSRVGGAAAVSNSLTLSLSGLSVEDQYSYPSDGHDPLSPTDADADNRAYLTPLQLASLFAPAGQPTDVGSHWHAFLLLMKRLARIPLRGVDGVPFAHLVGVEPQALSVLRSVHMERDRELESERERDATDDAACRESPSRAPLVGTLGSSSGASCSRTSVAAAASSASSGSSSSSSSSNIGSSPSTTIAGLPSAAYHCLTSQSSLLSLQGGSLPGKLLWGSENKLPVIDLFRILLLLGLDVNARDRFGNTLTLQQVRWLAQLQTPIGLFGAHHARLMALLRSFQGAHAHQHSAEALQSLPVSREARLQRYRLQVHAFRLVLQLTDPFGTRGLVFEPNAVGDTPADYLFEKTSATTTIEIKRESPQKSPFESSEGSRVVAKLQILSSGATSASSASSSTAASSSISSSLSATASSSASASEPGAAVSAAVGRLFDRWELLNPPATRSLLVRPAGRALGLPFGPDAPPGDLLAHVTLMQLAAHALRSYDLELPS